MMLRVKSNEPIGDYLYGLFLSKPLCRARIVRRQVNGGFGLGVFYDTIHRLDRDLGVGTHSVPKAPALDRHSLLGGVGRL